MYQNCQSQAHVQKQLLKILFDDIFDSKVQNEKYRYRHFALQALKRDERNLKI
jgi:hypothetical protein